MLIGALLGFGLVFVLPRDTNVIIFGVAFLLSVFLQLILHEFGHYLFGKMTGYSFVSFRVGSFLLLKKDDKLQWKRFMIPGTAGQCLMKPPQDKKPFVWYNMGGVIVNIMVATLACIAQIAFSDNVILSNFFSGLFIAGILLALSNGIPLKLSGMPNDGYNVFYMLKNKSDLDAFINQLIINGEQTQGKRLSELPATLFDVDFDDDLSNPQVCGMLYFKGLYLQDLGEFELAQALYTQLIEVPTLHIIHKNELNCERIFFILLSEEHSDEIEKTYTKELQDYVKSTRSYPSKQRFLYAYHLLHEKDEETANTHLKTFDTLIKRYPFTGEIEAEQNYLGMIKRRSLLHNQPQL